MLESLGLTIRSTVIETDVESILFLNQIRRGLGMTFDTFAQFVQNMTYLKRRFCQIATVYILIFPTSVVEKGREDECSTDMLRRSSATFSNLII